MTATVVTLVVLIHGLAAEPPVPVMNYTSGERCAVAAGPVEEGLRFDWPQAITTCVRTGAPLKSPRPERRGDRR